MSSLSFIMMLRTSFIAGNLLSSIDTYRTTKKRRWRKNGRPVKAAHFCAYSTLSNACRTCEHQAIASCTGNMAVGANPRACDVEPVAKCSIQDRVEYVLDLLVVCVVGEGEYIEDGYCCVEYVYYQVAARGRRSNGRERSSQPERSAQENVSPDDQVTTLCADPDVLRRETIVNLPAPYGRANGCQG